MQLLDREFIRDNVLIEVFDEHGNLKHEETVHNLVTRVGDQWIGDRAARILGSTTNIVSSTNASPIVVTATGHGLGVGDKVIVDSHATNTAANGTWDISAVTANTLTLRGTTGNGVGGATGTVQGLTLPNIIGMRLGTDSTAAAKTGAGAAIVTYQTGSAKVIDNGYPTSALSGSSRRETYKTSWAAGEVDGAALREVVLTCANVLSDAGGSTADTVARALFGPYTLAALDTIAVTWSIDILGA